MNELARRHVDPSLSWSCNTVALVIALHIGFLGEKKKKKSVESLGFVLNNWNLGESIGKNPKHKSKLWETYVVFNKSEETALQVFV